MWQGKPEGQLRSGDISFPSATWGATRRTGCLGSVVTAAEVEVSGSDNGKEYRKGGGGEERRSGGRTTATVTRAPSRKRRLGGDSSIS